MANSPSRLVYDKIYALCVSLLNDEKLAHTGYEVCEYSKKSAKNAKTPVLMMSAYPEEQSIWSRHHADAFIAKPFETGQLAMEVDRLLKGRAA